MDVLKLPEDLITFLGAGRRLEYEPSSCEAGLVSLCPIEKLRIRSFGAQCGGTPHEQDDPALDRAGVYLVPGVDLIESCTGDYEPEGLLVWFPEEGSFGVWDCDHDYVLLFGPTVSFSQIAASPARFINAQWAFPDLDRALGKILVPWPKYPFGAQ